MYYNQAQPTNTTDVFHDTLTSFLPAETLCPIMHFIAGTGSRGWLFPPLPHKVENEGETWTRSEPESGTHGSFSNIIKAGERVQSGNLSRLCEKGAKHS